MTISTEVRKAGPFIGNGSASAFPFAFKVFKAADLIVVRRQDNIGAETTLVLDSDYHVTLNGNQDTTPGGVVTLVAGALASGFTLVVSSELPYLQPTDLTNQGGFYPKVITNALDRLTIFCQQLAEITGRTLKLPITAPTNISAEIPLPNPSELIAWNETGTGLTTISPQSLVTSIAYGSATADLFAGDGVTTTFPLTTNPASVNNLDVSIGGHSQRPVQGGVGDYSWNGGASITFVVPPPAPTVPGDKNVLVRYMQAIPVSDSEALHAQTREALRRGYAEAGYNLVDGSFETGGTLASATDVLLLESTGVAYSWTGAYPVGGYVVAPGTDPTAVAGYVPRTDVVLRAEINLVQRRFSTVAEMKLVLTTADIGKVVEWIGYYNVFDGGGNRGIVVAAGTGTDDGGSYFDCISGVQVKAYFENGVVEPEKFGATGDGVSDDLVFFQKAANYLYSVGGGELSLSKPEYYLGSYESTDLSKALFRTNVATSKIFYVGQNTKVISKCGFTTLRLLGGSSSPFGWSTSSNVLVASNEETSIEVTSVVRSTKTVTVSDVSYFSVGDNVQLFRLGGEISSGIPRTPSRERAPCQILTIKSISGSDITFVEPMHHKFETRDDLYLAIQTNKEKYPTDIYWDGIEFTLDDAGTSAYVLFSRQYKGGFGRIKFGKNVSYSYGMSEGFTGTSIELKETTGSIESVSDWHIDSYVSEGDQTKDLYGLLLNDNSINFSINSFKARNYKYSGIWAIFGVDGYIGNMEIDNCGTTLAVGGDALSGAAVVLGMPNTGFYGSKSIVESPAYLRKNLGDSKLTINSLNITGFNKYVAKIGDIDLEIGHAKIEYDPSSGIPIFNIGDTGTWLNDATYYTNRRRTSLVINKLDITTIDGSDLTSQQIVGLSAGYSQLLGYDEVTVTTAAASTDTTLTVDDGSIFYQYSVAPFFRSPISSGVTALTKQVTLVSGNVLTLDSAIGVNLPVGTRIWTLSKVKAKPPMVVIKNITVNGKIVPDIRMYGLRFLQVAAGGSSTISIDVPAGKSKLVVRTRAQGTNPSVYRQAEYLICNENGSLFSSLISTFGDSSFLVNVTGVTAPSSNTVTLTLTSTSGSAIRTRIEYYFDKI